MAPLFINEVFGNAAMLMIMFFIGISFGFVLERAGFGSSRKLAAQFYFTDLTVFKVMFTAIITAMILMFYFTGFGWINFEWVGVSETFLTSQILGGLIMGVGFVIGGFCPGTSLVAMVTGKIDGILFVLGGLFGMFFWGETLELWGEIYTSAGYLGRLTLDQVFGIPKGLLVFLIVGMALLLFWGAEKVELINRKKAEA